jgi:hypothetical protein
MFHIRNQRLTGAFPVILSTKKLLPVTSSPPVRECKHPGLMLCVSIGYNDRIGISIPHQPPRRKSDKVSVGLSIRNFPVECTDVPAPTSPQRIRLPEYAKSTSFPCIHRPWSKMWKYWKLVPCPVLRAHPHGICSLSDIGV